MNEQVHASIPIGMDPTKSHFAYGARMVPKLVQELDSLKLVDRQRALVNLVKLCHNPETIALAIEENVINIIVSFLKKDDLTCRQKATECLEIISRHAIGRSSILDSGILDTLSSHVLYFN